MKILLPAIAGVALWAADVPPGQKIYNSACAVCHDNITGLRVPSRAVLNGMPVANILRALENGTMRSIGEKLKPEERKAVAEFVGKRSSGTVPIAGACGSSGVWDPTGLPGWNGWGAGLTNARFADAKTGGLTAADVPRLKLKWVFSLGDVTSTRSQPVVFGGRVFIGARTGHLYSIDATSGCTYWSFAANAGIASTATIGKVVDRYLAFVGDMGANLYAVDARTGEKVWERRVDEHPAAFLTATPQFHDGVLYVGASSFEEALAMDPKYPCCTFRGSISAFDAATGKLLWKSFTLDETPIQQRAKMGGGPQQGPSGAGVWSSPTIDPSHGVLYIATGDNYSDPPTATSDAIIALDLKTGRRNWVAQLTAGDAYNLACNDPGKIGCPNAGGPDFDFGSSPILVTLGSGRRVLVAGQKSGMLYALDPDQKGKTLWQARLGEGGWLGGIQWGSAAEGDRVYSPLSDIRFLGEIRLNAANPDPTKGGGLFAYQVSTGERIWHTPAPGCGDRRPCSPAQSSAASAIPGAVFSGSVDGHLRAYDARDGKIIWDFDTARHFEAVNGAQARGGAIDGPGPTIAGGRLYIASGYAQWGGLPGNALLAFSVDGK
jgi:polyvinyl alcohol dehydrogenase (cytochrome)